ncbi:NosD domain-containing protein, partial [Nanoarchaeota archaeon]
GWLDAASFAFSDTTSWHHVVGTYNGTDQKIYLDGVLKDTEPDDWVLHASAASLIGSSAGVGGVPDYFWNGSIDEVMIFNRSLTFEQITALYENNTDLLLSSETVENERWVACVAGNDGMDYGEENCSNTLDIEPEICFDVDGDGSYNDASDPSCAVYFDCNDTNASLLAPYDGLSVTSDTYICNGTYYLNDSGAEGIVRFGADDVFVQCLGTVIVGNNSGTGIWTDDSDDVVRGCTFANYTKGVGVLGSDTWIYTNSYSEDLDWLTSVVVDSNDDIIAAGMDGSGGYYHKHITKLNGSGMVEWDLSIDDGLTSGFWDVDVDGSDNIYAAGGGVFKYDTNGNELWNYTHNSSVGDVDFIGVATDSNDYIFGCGDLDGEGNYNYSWFIAKLNDSGKYEWNYTVNISSKIDSILDCETDTGGNIIAVGRENDSVGLHSDYQIIKLNSAGSQLWNWSLDQQGRQNWFTGVTTDTSDNIYATGFSWGSDNVSLMIFKFNSAGIKQWEYNYSEGASSLLMSHITLDDDGNIFVAGLANYSFVWGDGEHSWLIIKLNSSGNLTDDWKYNPYTGDDTVDWLGGIDIDSNGNVIASGMAADIEIGISEHAVVKLTNNLTFNQTSNITLFNNTFENNTYGLYTYAGVENGTVYNNTFFENDYGVWLGGSTYDLLFYYNNFTDNSVYQAYSESSHIKWNSTNGTSCGRFCARGNYWSDIDDRALDIWDGNDDEWGDTGLQHPYGGFNGGQSSNNVVDWGPRPVRGDCYDNDNDTAYNLSSDPICGVYDCDDNNASVLPPYVGLEIVTNTTLCSGTYYLNTTGSANPVIKFDADNVWLQGNDTTIIGNWSQVGDMSGVAIGTYHHDNLSIRNISLKNYSVGIWVGEYSVNNSVSYMNISDMGYGIYIEGSSSEVVNTTIDNAYQGIRMGDGPEIHTLDLVDNLIENVSITNSDTGIFLGWYVEDAIVRNSTIYNCTVGLYALDRWSEGTEIYYNYFINNTVQANSSHGNTNFSILVGGEYHGNYWQDIFDNELKIYDFNTDGFGDAGTEYPYRESNGGEVDGYVVDYGPMDVPNCIDPYDDLEIWEDTLLCNGTFYLDDVAEDGLIKMKAYDVTLECNNTIMIGDYTGGGDQAAGSGIDFTEVNGSTVKDCTWINYSTGVLLNGYYDTMHGLTVYNNTLSRNLYAISISGLKNSNISNNHFNQSHWGTIFMRAGVEAGDSETNLNVFAGNIFDWTNDTGTAPEHIYINQDVNNNTFISNIFNDRRTDGGPCIRFYAPNQASLNNNFTRNVFNCTGGGMVYSGNPEKDYGNYVWNNTFYATGVSGGGDGFTTFSKDGYHTQNSYFCVNGYGNSYWEGAGQGRPHGDCGPVPSMTEIYVNESWNNEIQWGWDVASVNGVSVNFSQYSDAIANAPHGAKIIVVETDGDGFLNSSWPGYWIYRDNVTFDCEGRGISGAGVQDAFVLVGVENATLKNCKMHDFNYGILLDGSFESTSHVNYTIRDSVFQNNTIWETVVNAVFLERSVNNTFSNNRINTTNDHVVYFNYYNDDNLFYNNSIRGWSPGETGIYFAQDYNNDNVFAKNWLYDRTDAANCFLVTSSAESFGTQIYQNSFNCTTSGIYMWPEDTGWEVYNNTFYNKGITSGGNDNIVELSREGTVDAVFCKGVGNKYLESSGYGRPYGDCGPVPNMTEVHVNENWNGAVTWGGTQNGVDVNFSIFEDGLANAPHNSTLLITGATGRFEYVGDGYLVNRDNLTVDCGGYTLEGVDDRKAFDIEGVRNSTIRDCFATNFERMIYSYPTHDNLISSYLLIENNTFWDTFSFATEVQIQRVENSTFRGNIFNSSDYHAVEILSYVIGNTFANNTFVDWGSGRYGVNIVGDGSHNNTFVNNTFEGPNSCFVHSSGADSFDFNITRNRFNCPTYGLYVAENDANHNIWANDFIAKEAGGQVYYENSNLNFYVNGVGNYWSQNDSQGAGCYDLDPVDGVCDNGFNVNWPGQPVERDEYPSTHQFLVSPDCGEVIYADTDLTQDLTSLTGNCEQHGLIINTSGVELNCSDYWIRGTDHTQTYGIYIAADDVNVTECMFDPFEYGIFLNGTDDGVYTNNTIQNMGYGIYINDSGTNNLFYYNNITGS